MPTIAAVNARHYRVPLAEPLVDSKHGRHTHFELILARVRDSEGAEGVGYTYTGGRGGRAIHQVITHDLAPPLQGRPSEEISETWEFMNWHIHYVGRGGIAGFAVSAVDIALWDLKCKRAGRPLWRALGGERTPVDAYAGLIDLHYPLDRHLQVIEQQLQAGHTGIKIKVGRERLQQDFERARAVRAAIGPGVDLMVDANMCWDVATAIRAAEGFDEVGAVWLEEPVLPDDFDAFREVGESSPLPLAMGENLHTMLEFRQAFATGCLAYPQPDASNCGGITGWLQIAEMARAHRVPVCTHGMQELHVSLMSAVSHAGYLEMHSFPIDRYTTRPLRVADGKVTPPETPGIGVEFDWDRLRPHREV